MASADDLITVYRSADMNGREDAEAVLNLLLASGMDAVLVDDDQPGVKEGSWEVRVPQNQSAQAEALTASVNPDAFALADDSHDLDLVTIAELQGTTGELEAIAMKSILDAHEINAMIVGASTLPSLSFQVAVSREDVEKAQIALAEARAAGPAAAAQAELEGEGRASG